VGSIHLLGANTYVGREPAEPELVRIADPKLAVRHCRVVRSPEAYVLEHLCPAAVSRVEAEPVGRRRLKPNDLIRCGDTLLLFGHLDLAAARWAQPSLTGLVGGSSRYVRCLMALHAAAAGAGAVLLRGEPGSGRHRLAWELHALRGRGGGVLSYACRRVAAGRHVTDLFGASAGLAPRSGLFARAIGGTLYLEDVDRLSPGASRRLGVWMRRRARQGARQPVAARPALVASAGPVPTEHDGWDDAGWDVVEVPPLRLRRSDVLPLAEAWLRSGKGGRWPGRGPVPSFACDAQEALALFPWPANLDGLHEMLRRLRLLAGGERCIEGRHASLAGLSRRASPGLIQGDPARMPWGAALPPRPPPGRAPTPGDLRRLRALLGGSTRRIAAYLGRDRSLVHRWLRAAQRD